jgi:cyanophycinase
MVGKLIIIGGGETKKNRNSFNSDLLSQIFSHSTLERLTVIVAPLGNQEEVKKKYETVFKKIIKKKPEFLFLTEKRKTLKEDLDKISKADLIFFGGGQQRKIMNSLSPEFIKLIQKRSKEDDLFIAGTSAGAMIFSKIMIAEGGNAQSQINERVDLNEGLNLLPNFIVDTHFIERGRFARLVQAVKSYPKYIGIGLEANTALFFEKEYLARSYGKGTITLIDGSHIKKSQEKSEKDCVVDLRVDLIVPGCTVDLSR